jgi:hypothetical protein
VDFAFGWFALIPFAGILVAFMAASDDLFDGELKDAAKVFGVTLLILIPIGNMVSGIVSFAATRGDTTANEWTTVSICDVTKQMGLESGRDYNAEVGARIGGSYGDGYFWGGIFGGHGSVHVQPGSALSIGFDYQGKSAIFELPLAKTTFIKADDATKPSVKLALNCGTSVYASQVSHLGAAHWRLDSGLLMLVQDVTERDAPVLKDQSLVTNGLAPIVSQHLAAVTITLSPELYAKILG